MYYKTKDYQSMGMAASQARFLGLTARMNNIEFEGQQINQQRTALSNKSASYYSDLLGMAVPTAPSVEQFTQTVYSFDDGALSNQITSLISNSDGTYKVSYLRSWVDDFALVSAPTSIITTSNRATGPYKIGATELRLLTELPQTTVDCTPTEVANLKYAYWEDDETVYEAVPDGSGKFNVLDENGDVLYSDMNESDLEIYLLNGNTVSLVEPNSSSETGYVKWVTDTSADALKNDKYLSSLSQDQLEGLIQEEEAYINLLQQTYGADTDYMVRYVQNTSTGEYEPYFYSVSDMQNATYDERGNSQSFIDCYKLGSKARVEEIKGLDGCTLEQDSTGRYINITIPTGTGATKTYALTTNTVTDQDAYEDAMNQYEYDKALYDQTIDEINAKIEIVQAEDKNLELRLKQLDTEHNAISNEKDAVSKVIEKAVESGFKTFG